MKNRNEEVTGRLRECEMGRLYLEDELKSSRSSIALWEQKNVQWEEKQTIMSSEITHAREGSVKGTLYTMLYDKIYKRVTSGAEKIELEEKVRRLEEENSRLHGKLSDIEKNNNRHNTNMHSSNAPNTQYYNLQNIQDTNRRKIDPQQENRHVIDISTGIQHMRNKQSTITKERIDNNIGKTDGQKTNRGLTNGEKENENRMVCLNCKGPSKEGRSVVCKECKGNYHVICVPTSSVDRAGGFICNRCETKTRPTHSKKRKLFIPVQESLL